MIQIVFNLNYFLIANNFKTIHTQIIANNVKINHAQIIANNVKLIQYQMMNYHKIISKQLHRRWPIRNIYTCFPPNCSYT